jgi:hypothetical protein
LPNVAVSLEYSLNATRRAEIPHDANN